MLNSLMSFSCDLGTAWYSWHKQVYHAPCWGWLTVSGNCFLSCRQMIKMQFQSINLCGFCGGEVFAQGASVFPGVFLYFNPPVFTREPNYKESCLPGLPVEVVFGCLLELEWAAGSTGTLSRAGGWTGGCQPWGSSVSSAGCQHRLWEISALGRSNRSACSPLLLVGNGAGTFWNGLGFWEGILAELLHFSRMSVLPVSLSLKEGYPSWSKSNMWATNQF